MDNKKVIIIGAGIAGLSAGCYLQMNGYDTEIFELHSIPGGLCTGWQRKGYTFDGCIHWLCGSSPISDMYTLWEELGAIKDKKIVNHEIYMHNDLGKGESFSVYADIDRLEAEMLRIAPEDKELIQEFTNSVRIFASHEMPFDMPEGFQGAIAALKLVFKSFPMMKEANKWRKVSLAEFQKRFKNPILNKDFVKLFGMFDEMPVMGLSYTLALLHIKAAGYPVGGSLGFASSIEQRYLKLKGKLNYNSRVAKILVRDGKAAGIRLADGKEYFADAVISAADGHYTIYDMLDGKYVDDEIESYYRDIPLFSPIIQVSLGVSREFKDVPDAVTSNIPLDMSIYVDPQNTLKELGVKIYNFDPTLAPKGKTSIVTIFGADQEYWTALRRENPGKYRVEKDRVAEEIISALDRKYGSIRDNIDIYDVATPDTYIRYTNNWKASFEGFLPTVDNFGKKLRMTLPGLKDFYMIGQWVQPGGGLPVGAMHGRALAKKLCKKDRKKFIALK